MMKQKTLKKYGFENVVGKRKRAGGTPVVAAVEALEWSCRGATGEAAATGAGGELCRRGTVALGCVLGPAQ